MSIVKHHILTMEDKTYWPEFLTVAEIAGLMNVSKMSVYRMWQNGELEGVRFGRSIRLSKNSLLAVLENGASQ